MIIEDVIFSYFFSVEKQLKKYLYIATKMKSNKFGHVNVYNFGNFACSFGLNFICFTKEDFSNDFEAISNVKEILNYFNKHYITINTTNP